MQPVTGAPRDGLTAADVELVVRGSDSVHVTAGVELLDSDDVFIADITDDVAGDPAGEVECGNYRTIHRTCRFTVARELQWGSQRIRPYLTMTHAAPAPAGSLLLETGDALLTESGDTLTAEDTATAVAARFNLGVYLLSTPAADLSQPGVFTVEGYDKLEVVAHPHGAAHTVTAGTSYLTAVEALLTAAGETKVVVDPAQQSAVLPETRVWPLDEMTTTLNICNDLLAAVNYRALWVDWDGYYRLTEYTSPAVRAPEWTYDVDDGDVSIVGEARTRERDFFATPNRWVGVRRDPVEALPVDGDGRYETVNQSDGDTSIDARGRTITRVLPLEAADQASLVAQVSAAKEEDMRVAAYRTFTTGPNPLHWHFDVARVVDSAAGQSTNVTWIGWRIPLDGGDMSHETREV